MRAVQYRKVGEPPQVVEVDVPEPGPGQLLVGITAAGICHSDLTVMSWPAESFPYPMPLTLGHEGAGRVVEVGSGVTRVGVGDSVVVYGPWGCGVCRECSVGMENYCPHAAGLGIMPPGLGSPGALAEYMLVDAERHVVPIGGLDPVTTVPLTDAGLTPYHAIKRSLRWLYAGSTTVVIGVGGLGHVAIQLLRAMTGTTVIALDVREESRVLALHSGAHHALPSDEGALSAIRELSGGAGATVVFDFVGVQPTMNLAATVVGMDAAIVLIGAGGGTMPVTFGSLPFGTVVSTTYWGGRTELTELVDLAHRGVVGVQVERYSLEQAPDAYEWMKDGNVHGRAVIVP